MSREEWRPVPGWLGMYEISSRGRVRSLPRKVFRLGNGRWQTVDARVLRAVRNGRGEVVTLSRPPRPRVRRRRTVSITTLMRETWGWTT